MKARYLSLLLLLLSAPLLVHADDMKSSKNYWMTNYSNYMEFTVLVTDLNNSNTYAKDGYIRAYTNRNRQGSPITLLRVYTKDMGNDYEPLWEVFAKNMIKGSKAFMLYTVPSGNENPDGSLTFDEQKFLINKGSEGDDTFVTIDYYYPPLLAGKTWYFFYEYEHNKSGNIVMPLGSQYCSESVDCSHFDLSDYKLSRPNVNNIELDLPAIPNDIEQKLQDVRKHIGHYDLTLNYTLFDGSNVNQKAAFDCQSAQRSTNKISIPSAARNFKSVDISINGRDALEAEGGTCFWDEKKNWEMKNVFPHVPQPNNVGADFLQFERRVDITWNSFLQEEGNNYITNTTPYVYRIETDQHGTPKSGQTWSRRGNLSLIGDKQEASYMDNNVTADGKYYKYLILNVPRDWENKEGLTGNALESPSDSTVQSLGHIESAVVESKATMEIYDLQQDMAIKDKVLLRWKYTRVPTSSNTTIFEVWRCLSGTNAWETYADNIKGESDPGPTTVMEFTDTNLPDLQSTYDYKIVVKLNNGRDQFESNVVTAGLLSGTMVTSIEATKGTHERVVRLLWKASQVGTTATTFELQRRYADSSDSFLTIYRTTGTSDSYTYEDATVQPGRYYEYIVRSYQGEKENAGDNNFQNMLSDIGFCQARGVITGRVSFGSSDTSVEDVRISLRPSDDGSDNEVTKYSQRVNGDSTGIRWHGDSTELAKIFGSDKDYTFQMFVRPDANLPSNSVLCQIPGTGKLKMGQPTDKGYTLEVVKTHELEETDIYSTRTLIRHALVWADNKKETGFLDYETCYSQEEMEYADIAWREEGYTRLGEPNTHLLYGKGAFIEIYYKSEDLSDPYIVGKKTTTDSILSTNNSMAANAFSLLTFQSRKGNLSLGVNDSISYNFTLKDVQTTTTNIEENRGIRYDVYYGYLVTFEGEFNTYFEDLSESFYDVICTGKGVHRLMETNTMRDLSVGGVDELGSYTPFNGNLTEVRVWDHILSEKEHTNSRDRMLTGRENGLQLYWPMDEGIERLVFDASYSNDLPNGRHASVGNNINLSRIVPTSTQLSRYTMTNSNGEYTLRGIPFVGSGSTYTLTPSKSIHVFSPISRNGFISASNLTLNSYNFTDESSFVVRGKVTYHNTNIPVDSVTFRIDGALAEGKNGAVMTDSNGEYEISVPIGNHRIEAVREGHHLTSFPADGTFYDFHQEEIANFVDSTLVNVTGRINGGFTDENAPLGFHLSKNRIGKAKITLSLGREAMSSFNYIVDEHGDGRFGTTPIAVASATDSIQSYTIRSGAKDETQYIHITTDAETGEFSALLPPLRYKVERITFEGGDDYKNEAVFTQNLPMIDASNASSTGLRRDSLVTENSLPKYYEYTAKFMRQLRVTPTIEVTQDGLKKGNFGEKTVPVVLNDGTRQEITVMEEGDSGPNYIFGHPMFVQRNKYTFKINVSELYTNQDTKEVSKEIPEDAIVSIMNNGSLSTLVYGVETVVDGKTMKPGEVYDLPNIQIRPDKEGKVGYTWEAGWPNLSEGYLRNLSIGVNVSGRTTMWEAPDSQSEALDLVILGGISTGSNFVTAAPDQVDMVIRRPPGNTSSSTVMNDTITNYYHMESSYTGYGEGGGAFVSLVPTMKVMAGFGFLIGTKWRPYAEYTILSSDYDEDDLMEDSTYTYTVNTAMRTPSGSTYTQNDGDTYIGRGTNILFSKGKTVGIFQQADGTFKLTDKESLCFANEYTTSFVYAQQYIEDVQIPNWKSKIQSLLTEVEGDLSDDKVCPVVKGKVIYYTHLKEGDPRRGTQNTDNCWSDAERSAANGYPSYRMVADLPEGSIDLTDSIQWCNNQIKIWQDRIAENEREKLEVFELDSCLIDNYSIAFGTSVSQTTKNSKLTFYDSETDKNSYNITIEIHPIGILWNNAGGYVIVKTDDRWGNTTTTTRQTTEGNQFSWTISDSEPTTALSVNVYKSKRNWGPIFRTMGGQTSCPYEGEKLTKYYDKGKLLDYATMRVENPKLKVNGPTIVTDVPMGVKAQFDLELTNDNEVNASATYLLDVMENSNPNGAVLTIDGAVLSQGSGGRQIKLKSRETIHKLLYVEQSNHDVVDYENIGLILRSQKDTATVSDPVYLSVHFIPASAIIEMSVDRTVLNKENYAENKGFIVSLTNLDRQDKCLEGVRIQFRRKGLDSWTLAKEWKKEPNEGEDSIPNTKTFSWPVSMPDDGIYELRAQTFGTYGPSEVTYETEIVEVTQDLSGPQLLGNPYPENGNLAFFNRNEMHIRFNEDINSNSISKSDNFRIEGNLNNSTSGSQLPDVAVQLDGEDYSTQSTYELRNSSLSLEGWFFRQTDGSIISLGTDDDRIELFTHNDGKLSARIGGESEVIELGTTIPADIWNYLAINYDYDRNGDGQSYVSALYVNSDMMFPNFILRDEPVANINGTGKFHIGGKGMKGMMHDIAIWDISKDIMEMYQHREEQKAYHLPGLVSYWRMDEGHGTTLVDKIQSRNIILPTESWYINNRNLAAHLSGDEAVEIDISRFAPRHTDNYTLELWFRGDDIKSNDEATFMQVNNRLKLGYSSGDLLLTTYEESNDVNGKEKERYLLSTNKYNDNHWHHLALNVIRGTSAIVYIDGESVKVLPEANIPAISGNSLYVGNGFTGDIDEIRIWNAVLTRDLIDSRRYERLDSTYAGLIGYFPMESIHRTKEGNVTTDFSTANFGNNSQKLNLAMVNPDILSEAENAPALLPGSQSMRLDDSEFDFSVSDREIYITFPENMLAKMDGNQFTVTVNNIKDKHGNVSEPIIWNFNTDFAVFDWRESDFSITKDRAEEIPFQLQLLMIGTGEEEYEILNLPTWMTVDKRIGFTSGVLTPLNFQILSSAPMGTHTVSIYVSDKHGIKRSIELTLTVTGDEPNWTVDPNLYESTMTVIGQLYIDDRICEYGNSYIAAFDQDGNCRGVSHPQYMPTRDAYYLNMNIYGSSSTELSTGRRRLTFKIYDAQTGFILPLVQIIHPNGTVSDTLEYAREAVYGTYDTPMLFKAIDSAEQTIDLARGWIWVSFYLDTPSHAISDVMPKQASDINAIGYVKSQTAISTTKNGAFVGELDQILPGLMYKIYAKKAIQLDVVGRLINVQDTTQTIHNGYNWIGTLSNEVMSPAEAFADLEPAVNDVVKNRTGFASYHGNGVWEGDLKSIIPGDGYIYISNDTIDKQFHYPKLGRQTASRAPYYLSTSSTPYRAPAEHYLPVEPWQFPDNMNMIGVVVRDGEHLVNAEVGAFINGECRGAIRANADSDYYFLTIMGSSSDDMNKIVELRVYVDGEEYVVDRDNTFINDNILGTLDDPYVLDLNGALGIKNLYTDDDDDGWYTLQGIQLPKKPSVHGVYIHHGVKVTIK